LQNSRALSASEDEALIKETLKFIGTNARDQDVIYFFASLGMNNKARRLLTQYMQDEYDVVRYLRMLTV